MSTLQYATKDDVQTAIKAGTEDVLNVLDVMMTRIDERFRGLEDSFQKQQQDIQHILNQLDNIEKRLEISEQERLVMGHQLERLDTWVHELATKIGYKLSA